MAIIPLVVLSAALFACARPAGNPQEQLTQELKANYLQRLRKESGLKLPDSAELLYHSKDEDRSPFSEQWILFSKDTFDIRSLPLEGKPVRMVEPQGTEGVIKVITTCIPKEKIQDPLGSVSFEWSTSSGQYTGYLLQTKQGNYVYLSLLPKKP